MQMSWLPRLQSEVTVKQLLSLHEPAVPSGQHNHLRTAGHTVRLMVRVGVAFIIAVRHSIVIVVG